MEEMEQLNQERIRTLGEKEKYKYKVHTISFQTFFRMGI